MLKNRFFIKYLFIAFIIPIIFSSCTEFLTALASSSLTYNKVSITAISLDDFSSKKPDGFSWDPLGGNPDIYLAIKEANGPTITKSTYNNVQRGTKITWTFSQPYLMSSLTNSLKIHFYDEENGLNVGSDDYMGGVLFMPSQYRTGSSKPYPTSVTLFSTSSPSVKVTIWLRWSQ